ncbi:MAG: energy transducer TonB [Porticoccaceae bacterium]|nr:energy transducer TonB [Porticoccaceae bacterium]
MNVTSRVGISLVPGVVITFLLLVLMFTLIATGSKELDEQPARKIADIFQPERTVDENVKEVKPEKPDEPDEPPPDLPDVDEKFEAPKNALSMAAPQLGGDLQVGLGGFARDSDYIPVYVPQPQYPRRAQSRGVSGYAVVEVIITTSGAVRDPKLIEEYPENYGFGRAAVRAAEKLKYNPRVVDGVPQEVPGVLYKFSFVIE